jgi:hypothetical protein
MDIDRILKKDLSPCPMRPDAEAASNFARPEASSEILSSSEPSSDHTTSKDLPAASVPPAASEEPLSLIDIVNGNIKAYCMGQAYHGNETAQRKVKTVLDILGRLFFKSKIRDFFCLNLRIAENFFPHLKTSS